MNRINKALNLCLAGFVFCCSDVSLASRSLEFTCPTVDELMRSKLTFNSVDSFDQKSGMVNFTGWASLEKTNKHYWGITIKKIKAKTEKTEILWIFFGIHTANCLEIGRRMNCQTSQKVA